MLALGAIKQFLPKRGKIPFTGRITGMIVYLCMNPAKAGSC